MSEDHIWKVAQSVGFDDYELRPMLEAFAAALSKPAPSPQPSDSDDQDAKWRDVALRFDKHRMSAIWHLQAMLKDPAGHAEVVRKFLSDPTHPNVQPAAPVGEVYTIEPIGGVIQHCVRMSKALPAGTKLFAAQPAPVVSAEQIEDLAWLDVDEDGEIDRSSDHNKMMTAPQRCAFKRGARAILALRPQTVEPMTDERAAFEARVVAEAGTGAISKWLGTEGYENTRVQDNRLGWVWCLEHLGITAKAEWVKP